MKTRLIMTLLVRDEADIIERNICFHLNHGVDFILAGDNGSIDETTAILKKYEAMGVLAYSHIPDLTYEQSKWVSKLAKKAVEDYQATHLFHCDADEFWTPKNRSLKHHLPAWGEIYEVPILNYLPNVPTENFWTARRYVVSRPYLQLNRHRYTSSHRYLLNKQMGKVLTSAKHTKIAQGNHYVLEVGESWNEVKNITIHHFPIRSYQHFQRKVKNGGQAYLNHPNSKPDIGWQWKEWYSLYEAGLLKNVYEELCSTENERQILQKMGVISPTLIPDQIKNAIKLFAAK